MCLHKNIHQTYFVVKCISYYHFKLFSWQYIIVLYCNLGLCWVPLGNVLHKQHKHTHLLLQWFAHFLHLQQFLFSCFFWRSFSLRNQKSEGPSVCFKTQGEKLQCCEESCKLSSWHVYRSLAQWQCSNMNTVLIKYFGIQKHSAQIGVQLSLNCWGQRARQYNNEN